MYISRGQICWKTANCQYYNRYFLVLPLFLWPKCDLCPVWQVKSCGKQWRGHCNMRAMRCHVRPFAKMSSLRYVHFLNTNCPEDMWCLIWGSIWEQMCTGCPECNNACSDCILLLWLVTVQLKLSNKQIYNKANKHMFLWPNATSDLNMYRQSLIFPEDSQGNRNS